MESAELDAQLENTEMKTEVRKSTNRRRAFTLLEVLMVVVIIGLLAAFVVPNLFGTEQKQRQKLTTALITSGINGTLDRFRLDMGRYPKTDEGLAVLFEKPEDDDEKNPKWAGPYIKKLGDLKDSWGRDLIYECPGTNNPDSYDLSSPGPDGEAGTDDDVTNWERT